MAIKAIFHVNVNCSNLEVSLPFYENLGFETVLDLPTGGDASLAEGLGMPAMEAMACKSALVTADTGGCRDYAINGETALISPDRDVDGLTMNLIRLLNDEPLLKSISKNGHQKISEFSWQRNCSQLQNIFKSALTNKEYIP